MSEETLFTAARRVVRFFNVDSQGGGLISIELEKAVGTLHMYVQKEALRLKRLEQQLEELTKQQ